MALLFIYKWATWFFTPLLRLYLLWRRSQGKEHPTRFLERLGHPSLPRPEGQLLWLHCASVGETLSAIPLLRQLEISLPKASFLLTTGTVTASTIVQSYLGPRSIHQFVPVDIPLAVERFVNHWHPDVALWFESELWPHLLLTLSARKTPVFLINARISPRSYARWKSVGCSLIARLLQVFHTVYAQSDTIAKQFQSLGAKNVQSIGNLKLASAPLTYHKKHLQDLETSLKGRPFWLAASTHPGEEAMVLHVHKRLQEIFPRLLTIIVPRHPHRGEDILKLTQNAGLVGALRTKSLTASPHDEVYIADTLGELGLFYRLSDVVFVGGSLMKIGGHNIVEPAHHHCAILQGPFTYNFLEITQKFHTLHAVTVVTDENELFHHVLAFLTDPLVTQASSKAAFELTKSGNQLVQELAEDIQEALRQHVSKL
jgi:3-deoxy-D-manno-octulosonic-acid transferase